MKLDCEFKTAPWDVNGEKQFNYTCTVDTAEINSRGIKIEVINGEHETGKTDQDVEFLVIHDANVKFFPHGIKLIFPNLKYLEINSCGLKEISSEDLKGFEELESLYLPNNNLIALPENLLKSMKNLREVNFAGNKIKRVNPKLLKPVVNRLEYADFDGNPGLHLAYDKPMTRSLGKLLMQAIRLKNENDEMSRKMKENAQKLKEKIRKLKENKRKLKADEQKLKEEEQKHKEEVAVLTEKNNQLPTSAKKFETLSKIFDELRTSGTLADFNLFHGSQIYGHKCIFAAQSSVLKALFTNETTAGIEIKRESDFSEEVFQDFFHFFYTQEVKNADHAINLLQLSIEYDVPHLKEECEKLVIKNLNEENALEMHKLAHQKSLLNMKRAAVDVIQKIHPEIPDYLFNDPEMLKRTIEIKTECHPPPAKKPKLGEN